MLIEREEAFDRNLAEQRQRCSVFIVWQDRKITERKTPPESEDSGGVCIKTVSRIFRR